MKEEIVLSVCLVTYNHETYIRECLDSFMSQNIPFSFEILVGDDSSVDKTVEIIENEYKNKVTLIKREKNLGLCNNLVDLFQRSRGKYILPFAGDDYLCDDNALYKMVNFLETHEEYYSVSSWQKTYNEKEKKFYYIQKDDGPTEYNLKDFLSGMMPPCCKGVIRNTFKDKNEDFNFLKKGARSNEEIKSWMYWMVHGKLYVIHEYLRIYRYVKNESASNYCSTNTELNIFKDYYLDIQLLESVYHDKYQLRPLKLTWINHYCIQFSNRFKDFVDFIKVLKFNDILELMWYKIYLKLHNHQNPDKWYREDYLILGK